MDSDELVGSAARGLSIRVWWMDELLRRWIGSVRSSWRFLEKKELLDAVIGVVGVLAVCRVGGGLRFLSAGPGTCCWRAATLAAVGVLSEPRVMGGNLNDRRNNKDCATLPFLSSSRVVFWPALRVLDRRWTFTGGGSKTGCPERLPEELLLILLA